MKKEVFVFILFLVTIFITGCTQQEKEIDLVKTQALIDWSESFPRYYTSENINPQFQEYVELALNKDDREECYQIFPKEGDETGLTEDHVNALHQCSELLVKKKAFSQKDMQQCDGLYESEGENLIYEECIAPIAAFLSIIKEDKSLCNSNLNIKELIRKCEDDYEKFI